MLVRNCFEFWFWRLRCLRIRIEINGAFVVPTPGDYVWRRNVRVSAGKFRPLRPASEAHRTLNSLFCGNPRGAIAETPAEYLSTWRLSVAEVELHNGRSIESLAGELA